MSEITKLPTEQEINPNPLDLDGKVAVRNFLGKTPAQITSEFAKHGLTYQEDLMFMGVTAFCFYFPAAIDYVVSPESKGDSDVVSCLCGVIESRFEFHSDKITEAFPAINRFVDHALMNYDKFELKPEIYGDLRPRLIAIKRTLAERGT